MDRLLVFLRRGGGRVEQAVGLRRREEERQRRSGIRANITREPSWEPTISSKPIAREQRSRFPLCFLRSTSPVDTRSRHR
ncbi:unnamed protein product [Linum trigynum]|uniref:Uncharacterized protein n=1 Tax=Linum trigynum TaxID=586398 RepID=A0AAV2E8M9_9ROSI